MTEILIRNGTLVLTDGMKKGDILIGENGTITGISAGAATGGEIDGAEICDAEGLLVSPGLIDLHAHLR